MSTFDKAKDKAKEYTGVAKERLGEATGNDRLQADGQNDQLAAKAQQVGHEARDRAREAGERLGDKARESGEGLRDKAGEFLDEAKRRARGEDKDKDQP